MLDSVDLFVVYNDVTFIKQGWISRNRILVNKEPKYFTVPIVKASSSRQIHNTHIHSSLFAKWKIKFLKTLEQSYKKAPYFETIYPLVKEVLDSPTVKLDELCLASIQTIMGYIGIDTKLSIASNSEYSRELKGVERVIFICKKENASVYVNAIGGKELYDSSIFINEGINLKFIETSNISYEQFDEKFYPNLSIIDVCMFNSRENVNNLLKKYRLT